ncbi:MAG: Asp-tRNA(Asn)/Glu-tRNA(Gln) amidotransferase subunit GatC, partial [Patescibacteria group bacterium]
EEKILADLSKILAYFEELRALDTSAVVPMTGGTHLKDAFRDDEPLETNRGEGVDIFPESESGLLKIPPVFEP